MKNAQRLCEILLEKIPDKEREILQCWNQFANEELDRINDEELQNNSRVRYYTKEDLSKRVGVKELW